MINFLKIQNIGIIDGMEIEFNKNLNVLTGETGAGKTLIVESLGLLAGGRFKKEKIKKGKEYLVVEASITLDKSFFKELITEFLEKDIDLLEVLEIEDFESDHEETIDFIVSRKSSIDGKNICKINGNLVTANFLRNFMLKIIDIHGQNENQNILNYDTQIALLDRYTNNKHMNKYSELYEKYLEVSREIQKEEDDISLQRELELLQYQKEEIERADLKENEDDELEDKYRKMKNFEKITENIYTSEQELSESVKLISSAINDLEHISKYDENVSGMLERIKSSYYELEEVSYDLTDFGKDLDFDENDFKAIENRLDVINSLKRKYGNSIKDILDYYNKIQDRIYTIENFKEYREKLESKKKEIEDELEKVASIMHKLREKAGAEISKKITHELHELEMMAAEFKINVLNEKEFNKYGKDKVEFSVLTNKGQDFNLISKIASGGEISRIMLAIKTVLSEEDSTPILVFDEIDTGISGKAGMVVGEKLKYISSKHQVLIVTHLATITSKGDANYYIYKQEEGNTTKAKIKRLSEDEVIKEIARIASGSDDINSLNYAKELRKKK